jgi:hypothetical protein
MTVALMIDDGNAFSMMETFINNEIPGYVVRVYVDDLCRV